ncbi:hypothetical protein LTR66_017003, partial [Elasticomyces elasticus]
MSATGVRRILVSGATGKQGGSVVRALLARPPPFEIEILALTRKATSASAQKLAQNPEVKIISGDLDNVPAIFEATGGKDSIWGVFSVQVPSMKKLQEGVVDREVKQGCDLFDESLKMGVKHFVYSAVDRGGEPKSWDTPTKVAHFITKRDVELHMRNHTQAVSNMTYTIIRPVAFFENLAPNFIGRAFAAMWAQMGQRRLQFCSTVDVGRFAALAFADPESEDFKNKAFAIAGDEITQEEGNAKFSRVLGRPMVQTYWFLASFIQWMVSDLGIMFRWFKDDGYGADVAWCKKMNPEMLDFETWLKME